jgi:UDP-N-acetylglucosamine:LPS N-acetylglucosamine transferase
MDVRKIFFVSNTAWSLFNFRISLMRYLKSQGHDVRAIAPYDGFADRLKKEFRFIGLENLDRKGKSFLKDFNFFVELYRIYKEHKPDLVLHFTIKPNIYGSIACGLLGIPSVANVTGLGYVFTGKSFLSLIVKKLYKFSFKFSEMVVFQNPIDYEFL